MADAITGALKWDQDGQKTYETGVKKCAIYPASSGAYPQGYAWNGITKISESPSGAETTDLYANDEKYLALVSKEELSLTISAYTYPKAFEACDGSADVAAGVKIGMQTRPTFGLAYRTALGNDTDKDAYGYKLHLIYGCTAKPSSRDYSTINDSPEAIEFSWEIDTTPVAVTGYNKTSILTIDSTTADKTCLANLEKILYGSDAEGETAATAPRLPLPDEIIKIMTPAA